MIEGVSEMTSMVKEHPYNGVIATIKRKNKSISSFEQKVERSDRGSLNPAEDRESSKAWITDGTMHMNK